MSFIKIELKLKLNFAIVLHYTFNIIYIFMTLPTVPQEQTIAEIKLENKSIHSALKVMYTGTNIT